MPDARCLPRSGTIIGDATGRTFTDHTLPRGTASAIYMIIPKRGARAGEASARVTVQLGVDPTPVPTPIANPAVASPVRPRAAA